MLFLSIRVKTCRQYIFAALLGSIIFLLPKSGQAQIPENDSLAIRKIIQADSLAGILPLPDSSFLSPSDTVPPPRKFTLDQPVRYYAADSIIHDVRGKMIYLYGESGVEYGDITLKANSIAFNLDNNQVFARVGLDSLLRALGKPYFKQGDNEFTADSLQYNFKSKKGVIYGAITEEDGGFIHGERIKRHPNGEVHIMHGKYTTCSLEHPHFYISMSKAKVIPGKQIISGPLFMVIEDIPTPIFLPFGFFPNKKGAHSGILMPTIGEEKNRGFFLKDGGVYLHLGEYLDLAVRGEIYTSLSWGINAQSNYSKRYRFNGNFDVTYNKNRIGDPLDSAHYSEATSFWVKWNHSQDAKARPGTSFSANVNLGTSNHFSYNTATEEDYLSSQFSSSVSYAKKWEGKPYNFSMNLRHSQNTQNQQVSLSLPVMTFSVSRLFPFQRKKVVGSPRWYEKISTQYTANFQNSVNGPDSLLFTPAAPFEAGFKHNVPLSASYKFLKYFSFSPGLSYDGFMYPTYLQKRYVEDNWLITGQDSVYGRVLTDTLNGMRYGHSLSSSFSVAFNPKIYGTFLARNPDVKIPAMRHVLTPSVSFSYSPDMSSVNPDYQRRVFTPTDTIEYTIFDNGVLGKPRDPERSGSVRFSMNNILEIKVRNDNDTVKEAFKKVKLIESLNMGTSYVLFRDSMNWSDVTLSGRTKLLNLININVNAAWSLYAFDSLGREYNRFYFDTDRKFMRLKRISGDMSYSFNRKAREKEQHAWYYPYGEMFYYEFDVPWNINVSYNFNLTETFDKTKQEFAPNISQSMRITGGLTLTKNWTGNISTGYDFKERQFTFTTLSINRDLHCWNMSFNCVPFGRRQSYAFQINIKSSMLKDFKYKKNKSFLDNF